METSSSVTIDDISVNLSQVLLTLTTSADLGGQNSLVVKVLPRSWRALVQVPTLPTFWVTAVDKLLMLGCPCSLSSVNWYQLASRLGVRYCVHCALLPCSLTQKTVCNLEICLEEEKKVCHSSNSTTLSKVSALLSRKLWYLFSIDKFVNSNHSYTDGIATKKFCSGIYSISY